MSAGTVVAAGDTDGAGAIVTGVTEGVAAGCWYPGCVYCPYGAYDVCGYTPGPIVPAAVAFSVAIAGTGAGMSGWTAGGIGGDAAVDEGTDGNLYGSPGGAA